MNFLSETFKNGVVVVNTTPHSVTLQDIGGTLKQVPQCGVLVNAKAVETQVNDLYVSTSFCGDEAGQQTIAGIKRWFEEVKNPGERLVILGSIIAAQAYPGDVVAMVLSRAMNVLLRQKRECGVINSPCSLPNSFQKSGHSFMCLLFLVIRAPKVLRKEKYGNHDL